MARVRGGAGLVAVAVVAGGAFAAAGPPASAQGGGRSGDRVQPPTELLREYPFRQGRLRSRARSEEDEVGSAESAGGRTEGEDGGWPVIWLVLAASALVLIGLIARRVERAGASGLDEVTEPQPRPNPPSPAVALTPATGTRPARFRRGGRRRRTNSYAVVNQKGGVGKTTVSLALGAAAVRRGSRALLLDLDPQASATSVLGPDADVRPTMTDVMLPQFETTLADAVRPTGWGLDLVPADRLLRSVDSNRAMLDQGVLARQLERVADYYDLMLIDCPPNLGMLTLDALAAASRALVVTEPTFLALHALEELLATLRVVAVEQNPSLELAGVVLNRVETTAEHRRSKVELEEEFGSQIWEPHIPKRAILQDAMRCGLAPQELQAQSHYAVEITEIFDALAARLERIPTKS
jgi:chromosome partitioning protein